MKALVTSYKRGRHTQYPNHILLKADGVGFAKAHGLLGKRVIVPVSKNKNLFGKVVATHGKKGVMRARFAKGVPGQAIGKACEIKE